MKTAWVILVSLMGGLPLLAIDDGARMKQFENRIRPLLSAECYDCHGPDKAKGGLRLDHIDLILSGGESGPALVPGDSEGSLLIKAVSRMDADLEMPPKKALTETQVTDLIEWVEAGAYWPDESYEAVERDENGFTAEDKAWWAIQPLAEVVPPDSNSEWVKNPIDAFVLRKLEENYLKPASAAEASELVRRLFFNLHGLPPTPDEVTQFSDAYESDPDAAVADLVDSLLASPRYGERWGQHWLDVVRYAESDGYRADDYRPETWRYRDYVIDSFNEDKPYDQFVREQLAGDELAPDNPDVLIGTTFLRLGIYEWNQRNARMQWDLIMTEMTNVTGEVFLGLGIGCAQCHDHKFDPILQRDHFALQAFLNSTWWPENRALGTDQEKADYEEKYAAWDSATTEIRQEIHSLQEAKLESDKRYTVNQFSEDLQEIYRKPPQERSTYEEQLAQLVQRQIDTKQRRNNWEKEFAKKKDQLERFRTLTEQLAAFDDLKPELLPLAFITTDVGPAAADTVMKVRNREEVVEPAFLTLLGQPVPKISPTAATTGRRTALADWIADEANPLSTRVITNRIWHYHFGTGLVPTPNDFGNLGESPSHPELLDWLTRQFLEGGWKVKELHRLILTSATYRQTARREPTTDETLADPLNRMLWRFPPKRLDAEQLRDGILALSGELALKQEGAASNGKSNRRSVYLQKKRNTRDAMIGSFDAPLRFASAPSRLSTTTPNQSLFLINSPWAMERASAFAGRLLKNQRSVSPDTVAEAYRLAYGREPLANELEAALAFITSQETVPSETAAPPPRFPNETGRRPVTQHFGAVTSPPLGDRTLWLQPGSRFSQLEITEADWPEEQFTIEAVVNLDNIHKDASVNTLLSRWNGSHSDSGWTFGVTSEKSRYQPRNFIMQLVGNDFQSNRIYEVVASNLRFPLRTPAYFAAAVSAVPGKDDTTKGFITFYLKDLSDPTAPLQTETISHQIVSGLEPEEQILALISGRSTNTHLWDGQLARLKVTPRVLRPEQLLINGANPPGVFDWNFSGKTENPPAPNTAWRSKDTPKPASQHMSALADFCQALFNSNEFLYLH